MTRNAMLLSEERQLFSEQKRECLRDIEAGNRVFSSSKRDWVLREGYSVAGRAGAKDFAGVVQGLAPGITGTHGQLLEQVVGPELHLQSIVIRIAAVIAGAYNPCIAVHAADGNGVERLGRRAGSEIGGHQIGEVSLEIGDEGIAVHRLQQMGGMVAHVAGLEDRVPGELALHSEAPGMNPIWFEIGVNNGLSQCPRIVRSRDKRG